nr:plastidic RNA polymerase sigma-subunit 6 [Passiflora biflora]
MGILNEIKLLCCSSGHELHFIIPKRRLLRHILPVNTFQMEVGMAWLSSPISFPSRTRLKNCIPSSVLMFQAQTIHLVHCHPMREEHNPPLNTSKEDGRSQEALDRKEMEMETSFYKEESDESYQFARKFEHQLSNKPVFWNMVPPSPTQETGYTYMTVQSSNASRLSDVEPVVSINIAKKASVASKEVALITKNSTNLDSVSSGFVSFGFVSSYSMFKFFCDSMLFSLYLNICSADYRSSSNFALHEKNIVVRSTRHLERRSKFRGVSKTTAIVPEPHNSKRINRRRKKRKSHGSNSNDPVQFFLGGQATTQLLTPDEESELVIHWKNLRKLETVKSKLQSSLGREPTMSEWAQNAGVSRPVLQTQVVSGVRSRQKLITASLRMVVHIAKQYQVQGLSLQDLIQAGTVGLLTSFEKFKPRMGCRFGTYAFWWIRHSVQRAVCHHSRIIRLPVMAAAFFS